MIIWLALLFPILGIIILYIFFHKKIAWWESSLVFLTVLVFIVIMKYTTEMCQVSDTEYIQDYIVRVEYYEDWNEEVPCSHPQYCERYNSCKSTNSKGECQGGYESYQCGYQHLYDVDYHPEYWSMYSAGGRSYDINRKEWEKLKNQFHATPVFKDMGRDYHDNDGDMYHFAWDNIVETVEYVTIAHNYENRVQAAHSVYNYPELDTMYMKLYNIKDYPKISNLEAHALLGDNNHYVDEYINKTNSLFAASKQVKIFYLVYQNVPIDAAIKQEQYWKGGNKNEVNICIGIDKNRKIEWAYVFSWTKKENVKIEIRDYINKQSVLDNKTYKNIIDYSNKVIVDKFERRHFKEFSYLTVEPPKSAVIWAFIISFLLTVGLSIWVITNNIDSDGFNSNYSIYGKINKYY